MKNKSYMLALIFFVLGIFITTGFYFYLNDDVQSSAGINIKARSAQNSSLTTTESATLDERVNGLEATSERIQYSIEDVNAKLGVILQRLGENGDSAAGHNTAQSATANFQSKENSDYNKKKIYNDLSDTTKTLPDILNSSEMAALPPQDQQEILDELTRRIDSGELDKTKFLPGYRSKD